TRLVGDVRADDARAFLGEAAHRRGADARRAAGDDRDFAGEPAHGRPRCNKRSSTASTGSLFARITAYASGESHKVAKAHERVLRTGAASVWIGGAPIYLPLAGGSGLLTWPASRARGDGYGKRAWVGFGLVLGALLTAERPG